MFCKPKGLLTRQASRDYQRSYEKDEQQSIWVCSGSAVLRAARGSYWARFVADGTRPLSLRTLGKATGGAVVFSE